MIFNSSNKYSYSFQTSHFVPKAQHTIASLLNICSQSEPNVEQNLLLNWNSFTGRYIQISVVFNPDYWWKHHEKGFSENAGKKPLGVIYAPFRGPLDPRWPSASTKLLWIHNERRSAWISQLSIMTFRVFLSKFSKIQQNFLWITYKTLFRFTKDMFYIDKLS